MRLIALILIALCVLTVPICAMKEPESKNKLTRTCNDLVTCREILEQAAEYAPETPARRHKKKIEETLESVNDARNELPITSPKKKKFKKTYEWTENTDPNIRAFPTIESILDKPSIKNSKTIPESVKHKMVDNTKELRTLYTVEPHKKAVKKTMQYNADINKQND